MEEARGMRFFKEEEEDVFVGSSLEMLPKRPTMGCTFEEKAVYMEKSIAWLKMEINELKSQDRLLMRKFRTMLVTVEGLKKFRHTVEEQEEILGDLASNSGVDLQPHLVDVSTSCFEESEDRIWKRQLSNYQRYKRVGFEQRHVSFH